MSTPPSPASRDARAGPARAVGGVVEFTERGEAALDELAHTLAARYDGTSESITHLVQQMLDTDIADLAVTMTDVAQASRSIGDDPSIPQSTLPRP